MLEETHRRPWTAVIALLMITLPLATLAPTTAAEDGPPPTLEAIEWLERTENGDGDPVLHVKLTIDAPAGLDGGEVTAKAFNYQIVETASLPSLSSGTHDVVVDLTPERYVAFGRELTELALEGGDGQRTEYGLCELIDVDETREQPERPRQAVRCLPEGGGWAVWTVQATGQDAWARTWALGVSSGGGEAAGVGHVIQDAQGELGTWGVLVGRVATDHGDEVYLRAAGETVVEQSEPDDHPHYEIVIGAGSETFDVPQTGSFTFATYFAAKDGTFLNQRLLSLIGENVEIVDEQVGDSVGLFDTEAHDFDARARQESPVDGFGAGAHALGHVDVSVADSLTYYRAWFTGVQHAFTSAAVTHSEGPDGPLATVYPVALPPGEYDWYVHASATTSPDADWVLAYADMPIPPNPQSITSGIV